MNAKSLELAALYSVKYEKTKKGKEEKNPHRVQVEGLFMQPTGGKGSKPYNFSYCYFGMVGTDGTFIGGFSMPNAAMLETVSSGFMSEGFLELFKTYAERHAATETVLKVK